MPIKEFKCLECGEEVEEIVKSEVDAIVCTNCESIMQAVFPTKTTFSLKGGGWASPSGHKG